MTKWGKRGGTSAVVLLATACCGVALIIPAGQQLRRPSRPSLRHATTMRASLGVAKNGVPIGGISGFQKEPWNEPSTSSRSARGSLLRRQVFWDGLLNASESGRRSKQKRKGARPDPPGFPRASTLLRPVLEKREHFLDTPVVKFKANKPSWYQQFRHRFKPLGRISLRTKVVWIDLTRDLALTSQPQLFQEPDLTLFSFTQTLKTAAHDPRINVVLINFSVPSLSMAAIMEVRRAMDYYTQSGKPLWGFTESYVDMTVLSLMGGCTRRIATEEAYCSFRGFSTEAQFFKKALENIGVEPAVKRIGEFKSFGDTFSRDSMSKAQREVTTNLLETVSGFKTGLLARSSGKSEAEVEALYDSDIPVTVRMLKDFGLLDDVLYRDELRVLLALAVATPRRKRRLLKWTGKVSGKKLLGVLSSKSIIEAPTYLKRVRRNPVEGVPGRKGDKTIAVINAEGGIVDDEFAEIGGKGNNLVISQFREMTAKIISDKTIDGVVIRVSSPGGDAGVSDLMWREVRRLREEGKVVVASIADVAASGGYYIAMSCERIVCDELSITGSIGVVSTMLKIGELLDKIGISSEVISKGKYAELFSSRSLTAQEDAYFGRGAMESYNAFVTKAASSRRMSVEDMQRRAQGRVWTGAEAKALGLVDDLGGLDKAIEICRDMVDLKDRAQRKMKAHKMLDKESEEEEKKDSERAKPPSDVKKAKDSSSVTVESDEGKRDGKDVDAAESKVIIPADKIPFGPLGIPPEKYSTLQAKIVEEAEKEERELAEEREKAGTERLTKVINVQPAGGFFSQLSNSVAESNQLARYFGFRKDESSRAAENNALLKGLGSLLSPEISRPMAVLDDNIARIVPGVSGVPEELRNLGVGPTLYSVLQRCPGLSDALLEMAAKVGLSSLLGK